jgi:hypothetical protein
MDGVSITKIACRRAVSPLCLSVESAGAPGKGGRRAEAKRPVCRICGRASEEIICQACVERLRGEALERKRKEEKAAA